MAALAEAGVPLPRAGVLLQRVCRHEAQENANVVRSHETRPLFAFAGSWRPWTDVRGTKAENPDRVEEEHRLFSFMTCEANGVVGPIHPKAMPVLLTTPEEWSAWLTAPTEIALELQRPLPDALMQIVATGERRGPA